jgi:hypothetical protein
MELTVKQAGAGGDRRGLEGTKSAPQVPCP